MNDKQLINLFKEGVIIDDRIRQHSLIRFVNNELRDGAL